MILHHLKLCPNHDTNFTNQGYDDFFFLFHSINFRDPQYPEDFEFEANLLEGVTLPPPTLKPEHMDRGGRGRPGSYNPQIGFSQRHQRTFGAPDSARRMIR